MATITITLEARDAADLADVLRFRLKKLELENAPPEHIRQVKRLMGIVGNAAMESLMAHSSQQR